MNNGQIVNYTYEEISDTLKTIQKCMREDKYSISQNANRIENNDFMAEYNLTTAKIKDIISAIEVTDFCYGLQNEHIGFEHEILYVFCPQIELPYGNVVEVIDIYSKFNILDGERVVVISFHKRNHPINYLFRQITDDDNNKSEEGAL